jgi:uncharacterized MnhB-related membrane protein
VSSSQSVVGLEFYFNLIFLILQALSQQEYIIIQIIILKHILKLLNQNLLHSSLFLSLMSVVSCMGFPAIKPLALTKFVVKLLR